MSKASIFITTYLVLLLCYLLIIYTTLGLTAVGGCLLIVYIGYNFKYIIDYIKGYSNKKTDQLYEQI